MKFYLIGFSRLTLEHKKGNETSSVDAIDINLETSHNMDKSKLFDKDKMPNETGTKMLTQTFVQGLIANIHAAHQKKYWDSAEHLRYIIAELEKGFATPANISQSKI